MSLHSPTVRPLTRGQRDAANLYTAWSVRLARTVELVGPASYEYWILLEWAPDLTNFCERPAVNGDSTSQPLAPDFWLNPRGRAPYYANLIPDGCLARFSDGQPVPTFAVGGDVATLNGLKRTWVSDRVLRDRVVGIRNRKFLNPFAAEAAERPDLSRREAIRRLVKVRGISSWRDIENGFNQASRYRVRCELALLLHRGILHADLDENLVTDALLLSASP